jgi:hypothetical protein
VRRDRIERGLRARLFKEGRGICFSCREALPLWQMTKRAGGKQPPTECKSCMALRLDGAHAEGDKAPGAPPLLTAPKLQASTALRYNPELDRITRNAKDIAQPPDILAD